MTTMEQIEVDAKCIKLRTGHWPDATQALTRLKDMALLALRSPAAELEAAAKVWRCFHCDEVFTERSAAVDHFGCDETVDAACRIKAGAERSILRALRRAESDCAQAWSAVHNETTDAAKAYHAQAARHQTSLVSAEELGYERGLADGQALAQGGQGGVEKRSGNERRSSKNARSSTRMTLDTRTRKADRRSPAQVKENAAGQEAGKGNLPELRGRLVSAGPAVADKCAEVPKERLIADMPMSPNPVPAAPLASAEAVQLRWLIGELNDYRLFDIENHIDDSDANNILATFERQFPGALPLPQAEGEK